MRDNTITDGALNVMANDALKKIPQGAKDAAMEWGVQLDSLRAVLTRNWDTVIFVERHVDGTVSMTTVFCISSDSRWVVSADVQHGNYNDVLHWLQRRMY